MNTAAIKARLQVAPGTPLSGTLQLPGDKSITHRALICAALARGESVIRGALNAADTQATAKALSDLGAGIDWQADNTIRVTGTGGLFTTSGITLDLGNSGTGLRLLTGALAGYGVAATLTGDASLQRRPMQRIIEPLEAMGARIESREGQAPLILCSEASLHGLRYRLPVGSAQVKSAVLLAGLNAAGETTVEDPFRTRDHTERMLPLFGVRVDCEDRVVTVHPGELTGAEVDVPGDISSAAFLIAAALLSPDSGIVLEHVGINPTRTGLINVLRRMGADIELRKERLAGGEPIADLCVQGGPLSGTRVTASEIPGLIDELPMLMVLAAAASGPTVIEGADELRYKESDRIATMQAGLAGLGVELRDESGTLHLEGGGLKSGGHLDGAGDHRVAMALSIAGLAAPEPVTVGGAEWIATSFPDFPALLQTAGAEVSYP